jgi:NADH-quinone oxidoreductase subunit I
MNCGYCAEYCPFDAIKMDHDYEMASYDRKEAHIFDKERLLKPAEYYAGIRPRNFEREEEIRREKEAKKAAAEKAKAERAAKRASESE